MTRFTNIEAQVYYPEDDGVVQVEHFGIHARMDGTIVYGLMIESVMDRILENISLDNLARLLVDVHIDSSKIMESLLSNHQRDLLDMIFLGNTLNRDKVNVIIADRVAPKQSAERYLDKDAFENEIRQVLGDTYEAHDLSDDDVVITGSHGIMLVGPKSKTQEPVMLAFLSLRSRDVFVHNVFSRLFIVDDTLKTARQLIARYERDPNSIPRIRHTLSETSKDIILLEEVLMYLQESLEQDTSIYAEPADESGYKLYQVLKVKTMLNDLRIRMVDMQKVLLGARHEVNGLRAMTDTIAETQMFRLQEEIRGNSSDMLQQLKINERQSTSLDVMQVIFAGSLAFEILDRLTGEWSVVHTNWARAYIVDPFMSKPMVWFIISMMVWFGVGTGVFTLMRDLNDKTAGVITYRVKVNKSIDLNALDGYLSRKAVVAEDGDADALNANQKVSWVERDPSKWEGYQPKVEMIYDVKHGYLLGVYLQVTRRASKPAKLRPETLKMRFFTELQEAGVMAPDDAAEVIDNTRRRQTREGEMVAVEEAAVFLKVKVPGGEALPRDPVRQAVLPGAARGDRAQVRLQARAGGAGVQGAGHPRRGRRRRQPPATGDRAGGQHRQEGEETRARVASAAAVTTTRAVRRRVARALLSENPFSFIAKRGLYRLSRRVYLSLRIVASQNVRQLRAARWRTSTPQRNVRRKNNTLPVGGLSGDTTCKNTI